MLSKKKLILCIVNDKKDLLKRLLSKGPPLSKPHKPNKIVNNKKYYELYLVIALLNKILWHVVHIFFWVDSFQIMKAVIPFL